MRTATGTGTPPPEAAGGALLDKVASWTAARRGFAFRWSFASACLVASTLGRLLLDPYLPSGFPFLTFFPAIALTALFAGTIPGAVVMILSGLVAWYWFLPPAGVFELTTSTALAMGLYFFVTGTEIGLIWIMRRALERAARAEAAARDLAQSRSLMFAELQHRVSNNLSVVGSILALQRREVKDPSGARALDEAVARLEIVARLSRLLHDPGEQEVEFGAFLRAVVPDAVAASGLGERVTVTVEAEPVVIPADLAVPLGLVATELLSNALEHGLDRSGRGTIRVGLEQRAGLARLWVEDDGPGLPPGFDLEGTQSLGLTIARQFAGQIGAQLTMTGGRGTRSCLTLALRPGA